MKAHTHTVQRHKPHTNLDDSCDKPDNSPTMTRNKTTVKLKSQLQPQQIHYCVFSPLAFSSSSLSLFFFSKKGERHKSRERSERSQTKPPFTLMAGLLNACVHSGLFLVVSGRLRVLQLTVSSRFWDQFFRSKGTDVAQRRMWIPMMDHCLGLGSGCVCVSFCVSACVYLCERFRATPCRRSRTCSSCMHVH